MTWEVVYLRDDGSVEGRSLYFPRAFNTKTAATNALKIPRVNIHHSLRLQVREVPKVKKQAKKKVKKVK